MGFSGGGSSGASVLVAVGICVPYGGDGAPSGYVLCDGSAISRTGFANLFNIIGTSFGVGDGSTTFNVPDMRTNNSFPRGATNDGDVGGTGGVDDVTLTDDQCALVSHNHNFTTFGGVSNGVVGANLANIQSSPNAGTTTTEGLAVADDPHENRPPFVNFNWVIKA